MQGYAESQEREVNRYLDEIKDVNIGSAHDKRINEALDFFEIGKLQKNINILDVGCRDGRQIEILKSKGFEQVKGIELTIKGVNFCLDKGLDVIQADIHNLVPRKKFNLVIATHVIEHCYNVIEAVYRIKNVLKDDGLLFIEVPTNRKDNKGEWGHYINFKNSNDVFSYCNGFEIVKQKDSKNTARLILKKHE